VQGSAQCSSAISFRIAISHAVALEVGNEVVRTSSRGVGGAVDKGRSSVAHSLGSQHAATGGPDMLWPLRLEPTSPAPEVRSHRTSSGGCSCLGCGADGFGEQRANGSFSATVVTLTHVRVANLAGAIDEVHGRPVPVSVRVPSDEVVVQSDGILEPVLPHCTLDVLNGPLECELRTVDADDREVGLVLSVHSAQEWEGALAALEVFRGGKVITRLMVAGGCGHGDRVG
jgi:hypothetical protein